MLPLQKGFCKVHLCRPSVCGHQFRPAPLAPQDLKTIQNNVVHLHEEWNNHDMAG
jgi:hypothetical protein